MLAIKIRLTTGIALLLLTFVLSACQPPGARELGRGRAALEAGDMSTAIAQLQSATTLLPTNAAAWNYLGVAYHRAGEWTNAVQAYSQALRFDRDLPEVRLNLGMLWLAREQWDAARLELTAYTLNRPNDPEGWYQLGVAQAAKLEPAAEKNFRESLRLAVEQPEVWNALGLFYARKQRARDAVAAFEQALKISSNHPAARLNLAIVTDQLLADRSAALRHYRAYLQLQPRPPQWSAVNALVQTADLAGKPPVPNPPALNPASAPASGPAVSRSTNALSATNSSSRINPPPVVARLGDGNTSSNNAGTANLTAGPPPRPVVSRSTNTAPAIVARPVVEPALKISPEIPRPAAVSNGVAGLLPASNAVVVLPGVVTNSEARRLAQQALVRGQQEQQAKKFAEALQHYRRAVQLDASYFEAHYLHGLAAFQLRNFKAAIAAWETALALRPNSADARYNYALALKADSQITQAADELEKLLALHPDEARGHLTLGNLYADSIRDIPRARRHYLRVLQLDPRNPQAAAIRFWLAANPGD